MLTVRRSAYFLLPSVCTIALLATFAQARATQDTPQDTLWTKAVALAEANQQWAPTRWHEAETIFDKNGEVEEVNDLLLRLGLSSTSAMDVEVIHSTKNGKDNADEIRRQLETDQDALARDYADDQLFAPSTQHMVSATHSGAIKRINERDCVGFAYVQTTPEGDWEGTAWLDAVTGLPVQVESQPKDLPFTEDGVDVLALTSVTHYNVSSPDAWYPVTVQVDIDFRAKYAVFTFDGTSKTTITLGDYERM